MDAPLVEYGAQACNYRLAVDVEMNTVGGYEMSSWERGLFPASAGRALDFKPIVAIDSALEER